MKLAIVSDLHIGYERFYEDAYTQAKEALEAASAVADAILIPGDVFDKRNPKPEVIAQAINIFREISRKKWNAKVVEFKPSEGTRMIHTGVPIVAIPGTHERTAEGKENVLALLGLAGLLVDASEAYVTIENGKERICVFGLGGVSEERVLESIKRLNPKPIPNAFNIFMFHQSTYELLPFSDHFIHYSDLPKGFDLYVNGHIHNRIEAEVHGKKLLIPGSTVLTQLKDGEQEPKGFILFDTEDSSYKFIEINSRHFVSLHVKLKDATPKDARDAVENAVEGVLSKKHDNPIIKLYVEGTMAHGFSNSDVQMRTLLNKYSGKCILEIDSSALVSPDLQKSIEEIRDSKIGEMPIKELGMNAFVSKLKELKFDESVDSAELFNILSTETNKEKAIKRANELLDSVKKE